MKTVRKSKIKLTKAELDFVASKAYPETKHRVIQKLCQRFDALGKDMQQQLIPSNDETRALLQGASFKTTRGENHRLLPYVVVDFPKISGNGFPLLCRTMFWWGKYFSLNVIIRAGAFDRHLLEQWLHTKPIKRMRMYTGTVLWEHDLDNKDFVKLKQMDNAMITQALDQQEYYKLSLKVSFKQWDKLEEKAFRFYTAVLGSLQPVTKEQGK